MKATWASMVIAIFWLSLPASAATPDFSVCDELQGAAAGLCRAAVAVGCTEDASGNACSKIAEQFERITGEKPTFMGASLSPNSGAAGLCLSISDPQSRLVSDDWVMIHPTGTEASSGIRLNIFSYTPELVRVTVPMTILPGSYLISVLANDSEMFLKIGPLEFEILDTDDVPPGCGR